MYRVIYSLAFFAICISSYSTNATAEFAVWVDGQNLASPHMRVYGNSKPPIGHVRFCQRYPRDCDKYRQITNKISLNEERWRQLVRINRAVNRDIKPVTDQEHHGTIEYWDYPTGSGDCEDYVLLKRRLLANNGWPENSLLITVVRDEEGAGHAILTVRTKQGDYLLDNKRDEVTVWNKVPYRFVKRQSARHPKYWDSLYPRERETIRSSSQR
ncbi:hypothetical protein NBRC116602_15190 [Hyphomicrobiales bacterium 4NK60-0047b]|jgi:predicted transglutaminase-like cysteine proteinase